MAYFTLASQFAALTELALMLKPIPVKPYLSSALLLYADSNGCDKQFCVSSAIALLSPFYSPLLPLRKITVRGIGVMIWG